jgi:hypothetical protein
MTFIKILTLAFLILLSLIFLKVSIFTKVTMHMSEAKISHITKKLGNDLTHNMTNRQVLKVDDR